MANEDRELGEVLGRMENSIENIKETVLEMKEENRIERKNTDTTRVKCGEKFAKLEKFDGRIKTYIGIGIAIATAIGGALVWAVDKIWDYYLSKK